jgi:hydroxymethylpyrimidine pyrophosphatase-like HAD family hydrolase
MLVFDLDGVVTDLETREPSRKVLQIIAADLKQGLPVAFISGRTLGWMNEHVLPVLTEICTTDKMSNLLVVAEKGGVTSFTENGQPHTQVDKKLSPPETFKREAKALLHKDRGGWSLGDTMFWDEGKQTMVTIEKVPSVSLSDFAIARDILVEDLQGLLNRHSLNEFKVDATSIGTDVEHITAGKKKGAQDVLDWLKRHDVKPVSFHVFGDSPSDSAMAETFGAHGNQTTFIFVGDPSTFSPAGQEPYTSVITGGGYSGDAAAYLRNLKPSM